MKYQKKKDLNFFVTKLTEKIHNPCNAKKILQFLFEEKQQKIGKTIKKITQQPKSFENSIIVDIKSVAIKQPKTSCKISKNLRQAEEVSQVGYDKISSCPL